MNKKYITYYTVSAIILFGVVALALCTGAVSLGIGDIVDGITAKNETVSIILFKIRLPRVLGALVAGVALATAGCILQCVTNNPLCAPNIIGVNSGAGIGVMIMLCVFPSLWQLLPLCAFIGAVVTTGIVVGIAFSGGYKTKGSTIVLSGVAISAMLNGGISFLSLRFPDVLSSYTAFSVGGFEGVRLKNILIPAVIVIVIIIFLQIVASKLNLLCLGDEIAQSLGVRVKRLRIISLVLSAALCASAVSFAGLLGFVGLIVPNIVRRVFGRDMRFNISASALWGGILVVLSDWAGRVFFAPAELPAGIIMAFLGAPFFLYLLVKERGRYDD